MSTANYSTVQISSLLENKNIVDSHRDDYRDLQNEQEKGSFILAGCPRCGSNRGQWRGYRKRKNGSLTHRRYCSACKKWFFKVI